jgi:UDP-N-acetylglucosamine acyltransferase
MAIHPTAVIDPAANIDSSASVGPYVVIDGPASIAAECRIGPAATILGHTTLGVGCRVHSHAVVGDAPQDHKYHGEVSYVQVGDGCIIREGATVHRGTDPESATVIGKGCLLMTNSHVGHNCQLGNGVTLVSGALLGGHVSVGDGAIISGHAAVHQHVRIGELALVGILARITQDVPPFCITDREGLVVAENRVGLMRAGFSRDERDEIKAAFQSIHRTGIGRHAAVEYLKAAVHTPAGLRLLEFFAYESKRGSGVRAYRPPRGADAA